MDYRWVFEELTKLDRYLELPDGTTRSVMGHDPARVPALNEKLQPYGIGFDADGCLDRAYWGRWQKLMKRVGISRAWWMDGDCSVAELPTEIKVI